MNKKSLSLLCLLLTLLIFFGCEKSEVKETKSYSPKISQVVNRVTKGAIPSDSKIEVWFNDSVVDDDKINQQVEEELFNIQPTLKGKTYWKQTNLLVFEPTEPMEYWEKFQGSLNLKKLSKKFKDFEDLKFAFNIMGRELSSFKAELKLKTKNNPKVLNYSGKFSFSETTDLELIKEGVKLKNGSKNYLLEFFTEPDKKTFSFISEDIIRDNSTKNFVFLIDKDELNLEEEFVKEFQVTTLEEMKIVKLKLEEEGKKPKIRIEFSDEVDFEQNLNGLVSVQNMKKLKIQKNGSSLILDGDFNFGTEYTVVVETGLRSVWGTKTTKKLTRQIKFRDIKPQIYFASDGVILPEGNKYKLQFYSSNLKRVHIEVKKVYEKSLSEFIRNEKVTSISNRKTPFNRSYINRVGVIIHNETFEIGEQTNKFLLNEIDLSNVVSKNEKGLYLIRLNFNPRDMLVKPEGNNYRYIEEEGQIYKPLFFSNIGLICKYANNKRIVYTTDLKTGKPLSGVTVRLRSTYNDNSIYEQVKSDENGKAVLDNDRYYYSCYIEAEINGQRSVLKFNESEWNISGFDISGVDDRDDGVKTYIYTERGVYRPGDEINISAIVRHKIKKHPNNHPITLEMYNPNRNKVYETTNKINEDGFYNFKIQTKQEDPTGNWTAEFNIGGRTFYHTVKIETIVPYKLKVKLKSQHKKIVPSHKVLETEVTCNYLFGNPGSNLNTEVDLEINPINKRFNKYSQFTFRNPLLEFQKIQKKIFKGQLNDKGIKKIKWPLPTFTGIPSGLNIKLTATVFEKGGRPNKNWINIPLEPYTHYVGVQAPRYSYVATGSDMQLPVILVDSDGKVVAGKTIKYRIYKNSKHWWWYYDKSRKLKFKSDNNTLLVKEGEITSNKKHTILNYVPIDKGSYFIELIDESGTGHSTGTFLNAYPYGSSPGGDKNAGSLALTTEKEKYYVGETAEIKFPAPKDGSVLVTIEKYNSIIKQNWHSPNGEKEMIIKIPITKEMVPNVYVSVSLIQPHSQTLNDRPIRMFGILPVIVEDKENKHHIEIKTATQFRPEEEFEINLQTSNQKETQFTIAVVDEGLLDITQFPTPNPWKHFFKKVRLAVKTYDIFSHIIAANIGDVFKTFSIGGDVDYRKSQLEPKKGKKRFKPVSLFKGPIKTDKNGKAKVKFKMPNYVGSVRIMVIGANGKSFARAEKTVPVKTEIITLPTLPRVVGPGEKFTLPVSVFAMKENLGNVDVKIKTEGPLEIVAKNNQTLSFTDPDDKDCYFELKTKNEVGQSKVEIIASSGQYKTKNTVDLMVRPTSPRIYGSEEKYVIPGDKLKINIPGDGIKGTNNATLTISNFPNINFGHRLNWLIHYPYGCIEQTTSSVLPQLFIKRFIKYPEAYSNKVDANINAGLDRLRKFQLYSGGFSYWPHGSDVSEWGTLYGGHFIIEAKKLGYHVSEDLYERWLSYSQREARNHSGQLMYRVYRSYILAIDGNAELSEMNALKESHLDKMKPVQKWLLAAAYKLSGLPTDAESIIKNVGTTVDDYVEFSGTYGSRLRDVAMILDALVTLEKYDEADDILKQVATAISSRNWHSTQTIGYSLLSIGKYMTKILGGEEKIKISGNVKMPDGEVFSIETDKSIDIKIKEGFGKTLEVTIDNKTNINKVYTTLSWNGVPLISKLKDESQNLKLEVEWLDEVGNTIDPTNIKQGSTFFGHFRVTNTSMLKSVDEIALVQILPSGWEIVNTRLLNESLPAWTSDFELNQQEYLDIRDDRIMWFFDLYKLDQHKDFVVKLNAITIGEYNLPGTITEAMYNNTYKASKKGKKVKVTKR